MKFPKKYNNALAIIGFIQILFLIKAVVEHDWFYLGVAFVISPNIKRIINYDGEEE